MSTQINKINRYFSLGFQISFRSEVNGNGQREREF